MEVYGGSMNAIRSGAGYAYPVQQYSDQKVSPVSAIPASNTQPQTLGYIVSISEEAMSEYAKMQTERIQQEDVAIQKSAPASSSTPIAFETNYSNSYETLEVYLPNSVPDKGMHMDFLI